MCGGDGGGPLVCIWPFLPSKLESTYILTLGRAGVVSSSHAEGLPIGLNSRHRAITSSSE